MKSRQGEDLMSPTIETITQENSGEILFQLCYALFKIFMTSGQIHWR